MNLKYIFSAFFLFFLSVNFIFYLNFSSNLNNFYDNSNNQFISIENIIFQIHKEDSTLYKRLLIDEKTKLENYENLVSKDKSNDNIVIDLFTKGNFRLDKSFSSSVDNYFLLEKLRDKIINYHKLNLISTQSNYNENLNKLLVKYDDLVKDTINNFNSNLNDIKLSQVKFKNNLNKSYLIKSVLLDVLLFVFLLFLIIYLNLKENKKQEELNNKNNFVLDSDMNKIINFIKLENKKNSNPTIKDIKLELKLTHPTILSKLKTLEKENKIYFKKIGRNKFVFLKWN